MNYSENVNNFIKKYEIKIKFIGKPVYKKHFISDTIERYVFKIKISYKRNSYTFDFGQGVYNELKTPTNYDVLSCLQKYDIGSFTDFCNEYGYDFFDDYKIITFTQFDKKFKESTKQSHIMYKSVQKEYAGVLRVFSHCLEELREIC